MNLDKCLRALEVCDGVVREVTDQEILDAKAQVGAGGLGCEPASAASVAGAKLLVAQGVIAPSDRVVCILTGHQLKDPTATVAYHTTDQEQFNKVLGSRGVSRAAFANRAVAVPTSWTKSSRPSSSTADPPCPTLTRGSFDRHRCPVDGSVGGRHNERPAFASTSREINLSWHFASASTAPRDGWDSVW